MLSDLRRHPRYFLPKGLPAVLEQVPASVVDLSVKGARIQITKHLEVGSNAPIALATSIGTVNTKATVLWCQLAALALDDDESDVYFAGVVFDDVLPALGSALDQLIASDEAIAIQDSRSTERYCITLPLNGTFGADAADMRVLDLSIRGARINVRQPVRVGQRTSLRFCLEPGPAVDVIATAAWCRPAERRQGFEIGLNITGEEALMRAVIVQLCMRKQARVDLNSLRRKFDPLQHKPMSGMLAMAS